MPLNIFLPLQRYKMAELRYLTGDKMETVVVLLPDVWNLEPAEEDWAKLQQKQLVLTAIMLEFMLSL